MQKVKWLLQSTGVKRNLHNEIWFNQNVSFIDFGLIQFTNSITNINSIYEHWLENQETSYLIRGSTKILRIIPTDALLDNISDLSNEFPNHEFNDFFISLRKSLYYDHQKFDQAYYQKMELPLLNKNGISINAREAKDFKFDENKFVKPTSDGKAFVGGILSSGITIEEMILSDRHNPTVWDESILIAPPKKVLKEWRFFVLGDQVITGSQYCENHQSKVIELDLSKDHIDALACATEYAKLYKPSDLFTLDICLEENQVWSIVEYNCFNCSGLYKANLPILKNVVEDFLLNRKQQKHGYKKT